MKVKVRPSLTPKAKLGLSLSVSQRALQSIDILACSLLELNEVIQTHVQRNPFLKVVPQKFQSSTSGYEFLRDQNNDICETIEQPVSMDAYLSHQLVMFRLGSTEKALAQLIIKSLDGCGYLRSSLCELATITPATVKQLEQALSAVQSLDPPGIGARNLAECFKLQLAAQEMLTPEFVTLLDRLEKLTTMSRKDLAKHCGISTSKLMQMLRVLRTLDPHPGQQFSNKTPAFVTPDVIVNINHNKQIIVHTNDDAVPNVYFDQVYFDNVCAQATCADDKAFLKRCYSDAHNLLNDIIHRGKTITRIAHYVSNTQKTYFQGKTSVLTPLRQKDLAQRLKLHESTVSRAVANKFLLHRGKTIALQDLFSKGAIANGKIESKIKMLIQRETAEKVLSDEDIARALKQSGINVARRTIAKYRSQLNIPSSEQRRHQWTRYL